MDCFGCCPQSLPRYTSKLDINNALVAMISIGNYEDRPPKCPGKKRPNFRSISVEKDATRLEKLCRFMNWTFTSKQKKVHWTVGEIIFFLETEIGELMFSDHRLRFDGLIVCVSSHGIKDKIITSDYRTMDKTAFHRIVSERYPKLRNIPRIFVFDCCSGSDKRRITEDERELSKTPYFQHGFSLSDLHHKRFRGWTSSTHNPDYNLVLVHAANPGYVAKMSKEGSYLVCALAEMIEDNVQKDKGKDLAHILEDVQNMLHERGKQHTVNQMNNSTRLLHFKRNRRKYAAKSFHMVLEQQQSRCIEKGPWREEYVNNDRLGVRSSLNFYLDEIRGGRR